MREQHRLRIRWHTWLPPHGRVQQRGVDVQQHQILATAEEPVGRQMDLLGRREVNELGTRGGVGADFSPAPRVGPVIGSAQVYKQVRTEHHSR